MITFEFSIAVTVISLLTRRLFGGFMGSSDLVVVYVGTWKIRECLLDKCSCLQRCRTLLVSEREHVLIRLNPDRVAWRTSNHSKISLWSFSKHVDSTALVHVMFRVFVLEKVSVGNCSDGIYSISLYCQQTFHCHDDIIRMKKYGNAMTIMR